MAFEKKWPSLPLTPLTSDGTADGQVHVADAFRLKVKQIVYLKSNAQGALKVQVKRVIDPVTFLVGRPGHPINDRLDVSAYKLVDSAQVYNTDENQDRPTIGPEEYGRAVFDEEPTVALRTIMVDRGGRYIGSDPNSPFYVQLSDGSINIGTVNAEIEVALSHQDNTPHSGDVADSVRVGDGTTEWSMTLSGEGKTSDQTSHDKLDVLHADFGTVEGKQDVGNTSLSSIDSKLSTTNMGLAAIDADLQAFESANHTDLGAIKTDIDSTNAKLDVVHADLGVVETKQDTGNASLASIDSKLSTTNADLTQIDTDLVAFKNANHTDLGTLDTDVKAVQGSSGAAVPAKIAQVGGKDNGGNLQPIAVTTAGHPIVEGAGVSGTPAGGVVSVQGTGNVNASPVIVGGAAAVGSAPANNPVPISGVDGSGFKRAPLMDASGKQQVLMNDTLGNGITSESFGATRSLDMVIGDGPQRDGWGRVRVADTDLLESIYFSNTSHPLLIINKLTGSGSVASNTATSSLRLTNTTSSSDTTIAQTKRYFRYSPGKSYIVTLSGVIGVKKTNVEQRWGYFDINNGIFFQQDQTNLSIVIRTNASGSPVDTVVNQSSWNLDKLDGTGASGVTLDPSKHNLYVIDFVWHGAGRIRYGILYNGTIVYCHQVNGGNTNTVPFMRTPSLPLRVELNNTGTTASSTSVDFVCFAFQKESSDSIGAQYQFSASTGRTAVTVSATALPIISIRPKALFNSLTNRIPVIPKSVSVVSSSQPIIVSIVLNATLTGASFNSVNANSSTEFDVISTVVSGGTTIKQFYVAGSSSGSALSTADLASDIEALVLALDIAGTAQDTITVVAQSTAGNTNVFGQIDWLEFQ